MILNFISISWWIKIFDVKINNYFYINVSGTEQ